MSGKCYNKYDNSMKKTTITVDTEYITLSQFLKLANLISSGGEAKIFLCQHTVLINGVIDNRRGRKLRDHDQIEVNGNIYQISVQ